LYSSLDPSGSSVPANGLASKVLASEIGQQYMMALSHVAALLTKKIIFVVYFNVFFRLLFADAAGNQRMFKVSSFVGKLLLCAAKHRYNQQNVICAIVFSHAVKLTIREIKLISKILYHRTHTVNFLTCICSYQGFLVLFSFLFI